MLKATLPGILTTAIQNFSESLLSRVYFYHDVQITCYTNHHDLLTLLHEMLGMYVEPENVRGEMTYYLLCYESASLFPLQLPNSRVRTEEILLPNNTQLKSYRDYDHTTRYQSFKPLTIKPVNGQALSVISLTHNVALTQIEMPERYEPMFLRRYVLLMALGQLLRKYEFEPCHAAAITAPWDNQLGALIIGASGSGKTTLSLSCTSTGFGLLGDDLVMLREHDSDGGIHAHNILHEVSVRSGTLDLWEALSFLRVLPADSRDKRHCSIEQLRTGATRFQTPIRLLIFPTILTETQTKTRAIRLSKVKTLQALVDQCMSNLYTDTQSQEKLFWILCQLAEQAPGYRLMSAHNILDGPQIISSLLKGHSDE